MIRSNLGTILMAFAAGALFTMGSLIYSRTEQFTQLRKTAYSAVVTQASTPAEQQAAQIGSPAGNSNQEMNGTATPVQKINETVQAEVPGPAVRTQAREDTAQHSESPEWERQDLASSESPSTQAPANVSATETQEVSQAQNATSPSNPAAQETGPSKVETSRSEALPRRRMPNVATLRAGTPLSIRLGERVSTERNRSGDLFRGELEAPVVVNGFVIAERGSAAFGRLLKVKRARFGKSDLRMELTGITTSDGQRVRIQTSTWEEKSARRSVGDTPRMAAGAAFGAVMGALGGAARGAGLLPENEGGAGHVLTGNRRTVALSAGSRLTFRLASPVTITERLSYR